MKFRHTDSQQVHARAVEMLAEPHRQAMRLHLLSGKTPEESAHLMGLSLRTFELILAQAEHEYRRALKVIAPSPLSHEWPHTERRKP